ncbi:MAG: M15 family metallopeptidase [Clostridia bacterium]|nr:M15 family metallopeptidase [Clostridia bacterium]
MAQNRKTDPRKGGFTEEDVLKGATTRYRRRGLGRSGIAVILCTVIAIAVVAVSVAFMMTLDFKKPQNDRQDELAESFLQENPPAAEPEVKFDTVTKTAADVAVGDVILVNYQYMYSFPATEDHLINIYKNKTEDYAVAYNNYMLDGDVLKVFNELIAEHKKVTGDSSILVNSTYRSLEDQQSIYDSYVQSNGEEYAKQYVADPGSSEHHTGKALDLTIRYADGTYVQMKNYEHLDTFVSLCIMNGFVQRYPENKYAFTHINTEPWHYRYVGIPHSYIMFKKNMCLEEYVELVKEYSVEGEMLLLTSEGEVSTCDKKNLPENGYVVYYVPMGEGDTVDVPVPADAAEYNVSGDNCGGFIVSATFGEPELPMASYKATVVTPVGGNG